MALPRKLMIDGEQTVADTRTHVKVLIVPFLILLVVSAATAFGVAQVGDAGGGWLRWIVLAVGLVLLVAGSVLPWLRWITWSYTLTNKRIVEQRGILTRTGRVIPLSRVNDVAFEKNLNDRILGCGTLVIHDASEQAGLRLNDIPHIEAFHRTVSNLVFEQHDTAAGRDESV
jgi:membrane protein YdbS with pleckstrin-like domain